MRTFAALLLAAGALTLIPPAAAAPARLKPLVATITIGKKGVPGGPKKLKAKKGQRVVLTIRSAYSGEIHVHGYNIDRQVKAGRKLRIAFTATIAGRFEIELHARIPLPVADLEVRP